MSQQLASGVLSHSSLSGLGQTTRQGNDALLWHASLQLQFLNRRNRTVMALNRHYGPLRIQRPFYPEDNGRCHCYILHPPGGVAGGDRLRIDVDVETAADVLLTSPGAGKFYRCENKQGQLHTQIRVAEQGRLDWLPQETIYFDGTQALARTEINIDHSSRICAWDIICLGRPAAGEVFRHGTIDQGLILKVDGVPQIIERARINDNDVMLASTWGYRQFSVNALFVANHIDTELYTKLQRFNKIEEKEIIGISKKNDIVTARYLGHSAERAKQAFIPLIEEIRHQRDKETFVLPRIWQT